MYIVFKKGWKTAFICTLPGGENPASGVIKKIKGGTESGDVTVRHFVTLDEGP